MIDSCKIRNIQSVPPRSTIFGNEPHYIPGYTGYLPSKPFEYGQTYGHVTNKILTNPEINKTTNLVLQQNMAHPSQLMDDTHEARVAQNRGSGLNNTLVGAGIPNIPKKLTNNMVPGYTGYIPKSENYFGQRYAKRNHHAITDFEMEKTKQQNNMLRIQQVIQASEAKPRTPIQDKADPYHSKNPQGIPSPQSPYFMQRGHKEKTFITGYTGYIPKSKFKYSKVYRDETNEALNDFTAENNQRRELQNQTLDPSRVLSRETTKPFVVQKIHLGVPKYTGFIPGDKWRYGYTYGQSARAVR